MKSGKGGGGLLKIVTYDITVNFSTQLKKLCSDLTQNYFLDMFLQICLFYLKVDEVLTHIVNEKKIKTLI